MADPFSEIISLLQPKASYSKLVHASGPFRVHREDVNEAFYCSLLTGRACLEVEGKEPLVLNAGDFVLIPAVKSFTFSSMDPPPPDDLVNHPMEGEDGIFRLGTADADPEVQQLVGHCTFASPDANLLISLLPDLIFVRGEGRLAALTELVRDEARANRPARDVIVENLLQVLLIEAFRSGADPAPAAGLLRGLADMRVGPSLRAMHAAPAYSWTVQALATEAGLSRSAFFTRFEGVMGMPPMSYLQNWRMTLAKHMLRAGDLSIAEISAQTGYGSSSAFSTAFSRYVGCPPARYSKANLLEASG
ncbi:AraC family transcriptional regulator [Ruegeria sp. 2205SS24-7]|uniref:AraC family transcriptional regulator n=1 Tax=Ruegeria discodermiae TaxID=3064389 RepID=UPI00274038C3|nr:AraC family transcriptional regulator [Ruegeria sp. 2205SS24-7]MDP5218794.1 AraC family transcriptional regulator [Ruegeria sp. 2205SS24-7]